MTINRRIPLIGKVPSTPEPKATKAMLEAGIARFNEMIDVGAPLDHAMAEMFRAMKVASLKESAVDFAAKALNADASPSVSSSPPPRRTAGAPK